MTNIVTLVDACDIVAIGVDFGLRSAPIPSGGISGVTTANTTVGNTVTGNTGHPDAGKDGGAGNDDTLSLTTGISVIDTALGTALAAIDLSVPGVYVACTTTPTSITLTGPRSTSSPTFPTALAGTPSGTLVSKMAGVGNGATAANTVDYSLSFSGTVVRTNLAGAVNLFTGVFPATGTIPGTQSGTVVPGFYTDKVTATVNF